MMYCNIPINCGTNENKIRYDVAIIGINSSLCFKIKNVSCALRDAGLFY